MRIALIADSFPPLRTSAAVQLRDLAREFTQEGHDVTVMLPAAGLKDAWVLDQDQAGFSVLRLRAPKAKDVGYLRRTLAEFLMPLVMRFNLARSPLAKNNWDGVVWYSPSIFLGPFVNALKKRSCCKSYLVLRDVFPEWALDMGLIGRGLPYWIFKAVALYQYNVADTIGVQTKGNLPYFRRWANKPGRQLEVLQNWLSCMPVMPCSIRLAQTRLAGRKVFVYAGNMGVAQGADVLIDMAVALQSRVDIGFLFVGRGSETKKLSAMVEAEGLDNALFFEEIDPDEIPGLYAQCTAGLLTLAPKHRSHNIPGKFLSYMQSGLPVLASINAGNDLAAMIRENDVGRVSELADGFVLQQLAIDLVDTLEADQTMKERCLRLHRDLFSPKLAVRQIVTALKKDVVLLS